MLPMEVDRSVDRAPQRVYFDRSFFPALALLFFLRLPPYLPRYLYNVDEGLTLGIGALVARGGWPYVDGICQRGPLLHLVAALTCLPNGNYHLLAWNLTGFAFFAVTTWLIWLIAREWFGHRAGKLAAVLFVLFGTLGLNDQDGLGLNAEQFGNLPMAAAFYLLLRARATDRQAAWFFSGFLIMIAALFKQVFALQSLVVVVVSSGMWWNERGQSGRAKRFFIRSGLALIGFLLPFAVVIALFWRAGHLPEFIYWYFTFNQAYSLAGWHYLPFIVYFNWLLSVIGFHFLLLSVGALAAATSVIRSRFRGEAGGERLVFGAVFCWAVLSVAAVTIAHRNLGYYWIQALPPLTILAADGLCRLHDRWALLPVAKTRWKKAILVAVIVVTAFPMAGALAQLVRDSMHCRFAHGEQAWLATHPIVRAANRVRELTRPEDTIFVWGFAPRIYPLADRLPASRFVSSLYPAGIYGGILPAQQWGRVRQTIVPGAWQQLLADLNRRQPAAIVDAGARENIARRIPIQFYPLLAELLRANYRLAEEVGEFDLYLRRPGEWQPIRYDPRQVFRRLSDRRLGRRGLVPQRDDQLDG